jgi:hypothetical protein
MDLANLVKDCCEHRFVNRFVNRFGTFVARLTSHHF